jgi:hypothetical protein
VCLLLAIKAFDWPLFCLQSATCVKYSCIQLHICYFLTKYLVFFQYFEIGLSLAQIQKLRGMQSQKAPPGLFSLKDFVLQEALHCGKTFSCVAMDCTASSPGALWQSFKDGESLAGRCSLVHSTKIRPVSGSGRCCILDVTVTCSYGVESKQQNKINAQDGVDIISPQMEKQQRRSSVVHGPSIKL